MKTFVDIFRGAWSIALAAPYLVIAACIASAMAELMSPDSTYAGFNAWLAANMPSSIGLFLVFFFFVGIVWYNLPRSNAERQARTQRKKEIVAHESEQMRINQTGGGFRTTSRS